MRFTQDGVIDLTYGDRGIAYIDVITGVDPVVGPSCWMAVDGTLNDSKISFLSRSDILSILHLQSLERVQQTIFGCFSD
jgi:hypothetical protein